MAITTASATIQFNVGSFDYQTGLDLPPTSYEDKITPEFNEFVTDELDSPIVFVMYSVSFQGVLQYQHPQFNADLSQLQIITNPDVRLDEGSGSDDVTINKFLDIIKTSAGTPASGQYVITLRYAYYVVQELTPITVTYTINFEAQPKSPKITYWYDTSVPTLTVEDSTVYTASGSTLITDTEFLLYPPLNEPVVESIETSTSITYDEFWVGSNELEYTILVTLDYGTWEVLYADQTYAPLLVYKLSKCDMYSCLRKLYNKWKACPCGTKKYEILTEQIQEANMLTNLLNLGLGCAKDDYSELISRFNTLVGADCACLDITPEFLS